MHHISTKELLYLEDASKMFESIAKMSQTAAQNAVDPQLKSYMQSIAEEHKQWIQATGSIVNKNKLQ